ncbi:MAG: FTR1 family protein [Acidobacteria bacterium]|nr:FTR1 family protein [Acidobacteriota bacterium]
MFQAFVITLREGLEAFLIVAISIIFLRKSGRDALVRAVRWGVLASLVASTAAGVFLYRVANQPLWEGVLALSAGLLVATLTLHMWRASRTLKRDIEARLEASATAVTGPGAYLGVFLFTLFMITREGMETALLLGTLLFQVQSLPVLAGAVLGLLTASAVALLWVRYGPRVNLKRFFQVTAIFLLLFVCQLFVYGFHEMAESGLLPQSQMLHAATEAYGPEGPYGKLLTYALVLLPPLWLFPSWLRDRRQVSPRPPHGPLLVEAPKPGRS